MKRKKKPTGHHPGGLPHETIHETQSEYNNRLTSEGKELPTTFAIGYEDEEVGVKKTCPSAKTLHAFSSQLRCWVFIAIRCRRWGCRHCGERKVTHYAWLCNDARPRRLITLTVANNLWSSPREAYDGTKRKVTQLATKLRRRFGEFEYFKVLEVTRKGWPHYHMIVRSEYIPQPIISDIWNQLTGAQIVDVRKIKKTKDVYFYVMKYLAKQKYIPWTNRRVSWSRNFFDKPTFKSPQSLELSQREWNYDHPFDVIRKNCLYDEIEQITPDCWAVRDHDGKVSGKWKTFSSRKRKN